MTPLHHRIATSFAAQGLMRTLGAELLEVADGEVHLAMPQSAAISQQQGFAHAGALTALADSACGYAALTRLPADREVVSVEFKINLMRPGIGQRFVAIGRVQSAGRTLVVCTGEVRAYASEGDAAFKTVALMQATMMSVPGVPGSE